MINVSKGTLAETMIKGYKNLQQVQGGGCRKGCGMETVRSGSKSLPWRVVFDTVHGSVITTLIVINFGC